MPEESTAPRTADMPTVPNILRALNQALAVEAARCGQPFEVLLCDAIRRELLRMGRADTGAGSDATHNHRYVQVKAFVQQGKVYPSLQELKETLLIGHATAQRYLVALQEEGVVDRLGGRYVPRGCVRRVHWREPRSNDDPCTWTDDAATMCTSAPTCDDHDGTGCVGVNEPRDPKYKEAKHLVLSGAVAPRYRDLKLPLHLGQQAVQRYLHAMLDEGVLVRHGRRWTVPTVELPAGGGAVAR